MFSMGNKSGDHAGQGNNRISCVSSKVDDVQHVYPYAYLVVDGCWKMAFDCLEDGAQSLDIRCQNFTFKFPSI
ncbi:hypothetical protein TNCV_1452131 [Trichonephila clavipes]|nr:hypothetical protein TNCV_1452131 [Trichonephila clavipes]